MTVLPLFPNCSRLREEGTARSAASERRLGGKPLFCGASDRKSQLLRLIFAQNQEERRNWNHLLTHLQPELGLGYGPQAPTAFTAGGRDHTARAVTPQRSRVRDGGLCCGARRHPDRSP